MKRAGIILAVGAIVGLLVYLVIQQVQVAAEPLGTYPVNLPAVHPLPMTALLSNPLAASIFWIGLLLGEFSAGLLALKFYTLWSSRDTPEEVQDNSAEIQKLFDAFLTI